MKNFILFFLLFLTNNYLFAQEDSLMKEPSKESQAYHDFREKNTVPPYGLQKINELLKLTKVDEEDNEKIDEKAYLLLSLREKFTYNMIHAESFSQNCDADPPIQDEQKKIFAQLPDAFGEYNWSERQEGFFKANKDSVIELMKASILRTNRVGLNFKKAIVLLYAKEMIPLLIKTYNLNKKDHDILTVLMLLMKESEYPPFINSLSYKKLYADETSSYQAFLSFNAANEELIIKRANAFISK